MTTEEMERQRLGEMCWAAGVEPHRLINWMERGKVKLSVETDNKRAAGQHRRFTLFDGIQVALVERLARFGFEISFCSEMAREVINRMMTAAAGNVQTGVEIFMNAILVIWTKDGETWDYSIRGKPEPGEPGVDTFAVIYIGLVVESVINRWKTL